MAWQSRSACSASAADWASSRVLWNNRCSGAQELPAWGESLVSGAEGGGRAEGGSRQMWQPRKREAEGSEWPWRANSASTSMMTSSGVRITRRLGQCMCHSFTKNLQVITSAHATHGSSATLEWIVGSPAAHVVTDAIQRWVLARYVCTASCCRSTTTLNSLTPN